MLSIQLDQDQISLAIDELSRQQQPGYSLDRVFYTDPAIFEFEKQRVISRQWQFVDHASRIPKKGDYFLFNIAGEELIVVRGQNDKIYVHYNVCRHRGSRLCLDEQGNKRRLTCPYHAWSYKLTGELISARQMPVDFDPADFGLHSCPVRIFQGLIFIYLGKENEAPSFDYIERLYSPWFENLKLANTKIAISKSYFIQANWKLVVENFLECYHCLPAHPEYSANMGHVSYDGEGTQKGKEKYLAMYSSWAKRARALGRKVGGLEPPCPDQKLRVSRQAIKSGSVSTTRDGGPACRILLGNMTEYDGGDTYAVFGENLYLLATDDYVVLLRFTPLDAESTDVTLTWLVNEKAKEGFDYDIKELIWLWDVTTEQDAIIIMNNQIGIQSDKYQPGPYSVLESYCSDFISEYLILITRKHRPTSYIEVDEKDYFSEDIWEF